MTIFGESSVFEGDSKNPEINWISPNAGEEYESSESINLEWDASDDSFTNESISIYFSQNLGASFETVEQNIENSESYAFNAPDINSAFSRFRINAIDYYGNTSEDFSDLYFTIGEPYIWDGENGGGEQEVTLNINSESDIFEGDSKNPNIDWQYPNGSEEFSQGEFVNLEWLGGDDTFYDESISIFFSENLGANFIEVDADISINDIVSLTLPEINSAFGRFKITAKDSYGNSNEDQSNLYFTIGDPDFQEGSGNSSSLTLNIENESNNFIGDSKNPTLEWLYPNGSEQFDNNESITTQWAAVDDSFDDEPISIFLAEELGGYFNTIAMNIHNTDSLELELPDANSAFSRMKITAIDSFGNTSTDYGDGYFAIGDPFNDYDVDEYEDMVIVDWNWGAHHTVFIEPAALSIFETGTEIHIIDQNGLNQKECSFNPTYGLVSVGQYTYLGNESQLIAVNSVASTINCNADQSYSWNYMNTGETPDFVIYDYSENEYYKTDVSGNEPFSNFAFVELDTVTSTNEIITPFSIEYNQSSQQAFYFVINALSNNLPLTIDDWIIAMRDNVVVGARQWTGPWTDVPAMGNDGGIQKIGYVSEHQIFIAVIDEVTGLPIYYDVNYSEGTGIFGEDLTVIESISLNEQSTAQSDEPLKHSENLSLETREEYQFNIYRNEQLLISNYGSQIFFDDDVQTEGSYCYRIVLLDVQGEEFITSLEQCIEGAIIQCPVIGDTNGDNSLDVLDVVTMVSHILGNSLLSDDQLRCTDFNQDNALNVLDVVVAVSVILGN
ncbi:dockerin type I repeat-containing protein [Candidatus Marinimicrobia bacterium]|nr:dockerin type I repeat-containing protein [Candidatus Neomarinimicrobiota bacterium]